MTDLLVPLGAICVGGVLWLNLAFRSRGANQKQGRDTFSNGRRLANPPVAASSLGLSRPPAVPANCGLFFSLLLEMCRCKPTVIASASPLGSSVQAATAAPTLATEANSP